MKIMPPAPLRCCYLHWNVASDDFVLPAIQAIAVALFNISLLLSSLVTLFAVDLSCKVSPLLYAPLMALCFIEVLFILNEGLVLIVSSRGSIWKNTEPRKHTDKLIFVRGLIALFELVTLILATVGAWLPFSVGEFQTCPGTSVALNFTRAIIFFIWIVYFCFLLKVLIYIDPLGCFSPGLLEHISLLSDSNVSSTSIDGKGGVVATDSDVLATSQLSYWVSRRDRLFHQRSGTSVGRVLQRRDTVQNSTDTQTKMKRRLGALFCCLCLRNDSSVGIALEEVARGFYTIFGDPENSAALTDIIAGLRLVHYYQKSRAQSLNDKFRKATFRMMPSTQRFGLDPEIVQNNTEFDWSAETNQLLFEDLVHYMHYAMGVYGWALHVFDNLCCGLCQLSTLTCCRCNYLCISENRSAYVKEDCCMCHVGALRLQTHLRERDILYLCCENQVYSAPFCVCRDHNTKAVVVCVRGTLSFKDSLTDMSYSPVYVEVGGVTDTYVHGGMLKAALVIMKVLNEQNLLEEAFKGYEGYQLVITGHSLGAGIASVLALLIKLNLNFPNMTCYAFSPPGSLFSFPLAQYCKMFITSVVLGNDIVPRISLRSLLYLKSSVIGHLERCTLPKYKVLFLKSELRKTFKLNDDHEVTSRTLEEQVYNELTTQNWLREKVFTRSNRTALLSNTDKLKIQKSLSIYPADSSIIKSGLIDRALSLHPGASVLSESLFQPVSSPMPRTLQQTDHEDTALHRPPQVATPGTTLHEAVPEILRHCKAHDGNTFLPLFPPGQLLHITFNKFTSNKKCCGGASEDHQPAVAQVPNENIGVILVDKGMIEDHLPNHVLSALKLCKEKLLIGRRDYSSAKIMELRKRNENLYRRIYKAKMKRNVPQEEGFTFLVSESPSVDEPRQLSRSLLPHQRWGAESTSTAELQPLTVEADVHYNSTRAQEEAVHSNHLQLPTMSQVGNALNQQRSHQLSLFVSKDASRLGISPTTTVQPHHSETLL